MLSRPSGRLKSRSTTRSLKLSSNSDEDATSAVKKNKEVPDKYHGQTTRLDPKKGMAQTHVTPWWQP
ncbi:hypothetical protein NDU88_000934 [Pleurodeles waltl]|uniref:Uncharacterized protein n=1 Tax=Pleurodeles waltl TaxID=8319 RepID=A0AAV7TGF2_PLEWA|nr:hypothetical protein NDU88_000934 [Pleurodeles waltl]